MGRGGPPEPELRETPPSVAELLELARSGRHAASDYLEDALLGEIVSVGARRCGGGLAGAVGYSNVAEAAELALERHPELVIFEGSGRRAAAGRQPTGACSSSAPTRTPSWPAAI